MISRKTVLGVGAGASAEFGLPTGPALAASISKLLDVRFDDFGASQTSGDGEVWSSAVKICPSDRRLVQEACWQIRDNVGLAYSIDNFLDNHRTNDPVQVCGRLAIVKAILLAERKSSLFVDRHIRNGEISFKRNNETWLSHLFKMAQEGIARESVETLFSNLTFVIFNYDRCIEHFLFEAVRRYYDISAEKASDVLSKCSFIHPYGSVGVLPWQEQNGTHGADFGSDSLDLAKAYGALRTYTDKLDDASLAERARQELSEAYTVAFLGFAFHRQNMEMLALKSKLRAHQIFATSFGQSVFNTELIEHELASCSSSGDGPQRTRIAPITCAQFLLDYSRAFLAR